MLFCKHLKVLEVGIEPTHPKILDFESNASTNSATRALIDGKINQIFFCNTKISEKIRFIVEINF